MEDKSFQAGVFRENWEHFSHLDEGKKKTLLAGEKWSMEDKKRLLLKPTHIKHLDGTAVFLPESLLREQAGTDNGFVTLRGASDEAGCVVQGGSGMGMKAVDAFTKSEFDELDKRAGGALAELYI